MNGDQMAGQDQSTAASDQDPGKIGIIAGTGRLPMLLVRALEAEDQPYLLAEMEGFPVAAEGRTVQRFQVERLALFMDRLHDLGVTQIVFAGAVRRPRLDPERFDPLTATMVPRLLRAMQSGDDATLREVIAIFEEDGFAVVGADQIAPDLVPAPEVLGRVQPLDQDAADVARAAQIVAALGAVDVGQGAVVAQGLCLAVETIGGTDAMLAEAGRQLGQMPDPRPDPNGARGVCFKAAKPGQDRRIDLPALGPQTLREVAVAGLGGLAFRAGSVMLLDRAEMIALADDLGLFLWSWSDALPPE